MRSFRRARWAHLIMSLLFFTPAAHALDPFQQQQAEEQKRALEDPNKYSRPVTNELKGAEIKEYRDKINAVRSQVFREGAPPAGASLRAVVKDPANTTSNSYVAEGRFQDFTPTVRRQIEAKLQAVPTKDERVQVQVTVGKDSVAVAEARVSPSLKSTVDAVAAQPADTSARRPGLDVPRPQAAGLQLKPLRSTVEAPAKTTRETPSLRDTAAARKSVENRTAPATLTAPAAARTAAAPRPTNFAGLAVAAGLLAGAPATSPGAPSTPAEPVALIPLPQGEPLVVENRSPDAKAQIVAVTAPASALPEALKSQIRADKGAAALPSGPSPVQVTVEVRPDRTIRVVEVKPAAAPATAVAEAKAPAAAQNTGPAPAAAIPEQKVPASSVAHPSSPADVAPSVSDKPFPSVIGAKALATAIGLDPSTVRLKSPAESAEPTSLSLPAAEDRSVQFKTLKADGDNKPTLVQADGRFGDFAPATQQQIREILGHFNAAPLVDENSRVVLEAKPGAGNKPEIISISIEDPKAPDQKTVVVWKEGSEVKPGEAPRPATGVMPPEAGAVPTRDSAITPTQPTSQAVQPRPTGLAPSVAAIASKAYGMPETGFELKPADPKGGIEIAPVPTGRAPVVVDPQPVVRDDMHDFASIGKDVDFTDAIRAEIDAKLRAAVENGETWATDALKGNRQVVVTFEVDERGPQPVVRVKEVAPTQQDAANDAAVAMGLRPGEFFIVNVGDQALIVLEQGVKGEIRMADVAKFKLLSPDGDAKVFVNPNKTQKDPTTVLMLSRDSLKANRATLIQVGGPMSEATIKACMDANPQAGQFIVRLDPNADEKLVIKAMQAGVPDPALTKIKKRPEDEK